MLFCGQTHTFEIKRNRADDKIVNVKGKDNKIIFKSTLFQIEIETPDVNKIANKMNSVFLDVQ